MVASSENDPDNEPNIAPQLPCSPRSFAKAHLDRLRSESDALHAEVEELSQNFNNLCDEPESLRALRVQFDVLCTEVHHLEQVFHNAAGDDDYQQVIWDAVQRALRKRYLAEVASLRAAACFSGQKYAVASVDSVHERRGRSRSSLKSSDNTSSTETPNLSSSEESDSHCGQIFGPPPLIIHSIPPFSSSEESDSHRSGESSCIENSYVETPPQPIAVPQPKWISPATYPSFDNIMPSPVCPDLRTPSKMFLEGNIFIEPQQIDSSGEGGHCTRLADDDIVMVPDDQRNVIEASCLNLSLDDWFDPDFRQMHHGPSRAENEVQTVMEADVQTALEVLGFRRSKDDEEPEVLKPEPLLPVLLPLSFW